MFKKTLLAAVVFSAASTVAQANELSTYVTASVGQAKAEMPVLAEMFKDMSVMQGGMRSSSDRTDTAYKLAVGLNLNSNIAIEAQYIDLGQSSYKVGDFGGQFKGDFKTQGLGFNLVGSYPIEDFTIFAKAGYHLMRSKTSVKATEFGWGSEKLVSESSNSWVPSIGIGASYNINKNVAVLAEYERYSGVADKRFSMDEVGGMKVNAKHDIDFASVGLRYNF